MSSNLELLLALLMSQSYFLSDLEFKSYSLSKKTSYGRLRRAASRGPRHNCSSPLFDAGDDEDQAHTISYRIGKSRGRGAEERAGLTHEPTNSVS